MIRVSPGQKNTDEPGTPPATLEVLPRNQFGFEQARHLLWRAGFGGTPEQIQLLASWGLDKAVDYLVDPSDIPVEEVREDLFKADIMQPLSDLERRRYRAAQQRGDEEEIARFRAMRQRRQRDDRRQIRRMQLWWLQRIIETPRPLEEKMTLFWHGHFATGYRKIEDSWHMFRQNQVFRSKAMGNYGELLFEIIRDPAMIVYLDNQTSRVGAPNENLARELMELFSLGEGNYTEQDIKEGARALTGYTLEDDAFVYQDNNHDKGSKNILGVRGQMDGDDFVTAILQRRECSRFMARKLYRFFVASVPLDPEQSSPEANRFINNLAGVMLRSRYEIAPVLRSMFRSAHFYHESIIGQQIKSPVQLVVGAARSLLTPTRDLNVLIDAMDLMGQNILFPPSVKGWDGGRSWINTSTMFVRQNILSYLLTGRMPVGSDRNANKEKYDGEALLASLLAADPTAKGDPARVVEYLLRFTTGRVPSEARDELEAFVNSHGGRVTGDILTGLLLLISAMPEYQLC